jgi:RNA polymerase sigma-70 factor (ECF subfamily)
MLRDLRERGRWLARNVLPHEALIRARLRDVRLPGLDIDDIIQETYARILAVPSLESIRFPRQYAVQTARSVIIDHMRHSRVVPITSTGNLEQLNIAVPEATTEERLEFQGEIQEVAEALAQLPVACRETLILRRIEGLSQKETARRLKVSEKAVEKYMGRGLWMLAEVFGRGGKTRVRTSNSRSSQEVRSEDESVKPGD